MLTELGKARLIEMVDYLEAHPELHDQRNYTPMDHMFSIGKYPLPRDCGSTCCLAGHTYIAAGNKWLPGVNVNYLELEVTMMTYYNIGSFEVAYLTHPGRTIADFRAFIAAGTVP